MRKTISILCAAVLCCVLLLPLGASASAGNLRYYLHQNYDLDSLQSEHPYYIEVHASSEDDDGNAVEWLFIYFFDDPVVTYRKISGVVAGRRVKVIDSLDEIDYSVVSTSSSTVFRFYTDGGDYFKGCGYTFYYSGSTDPNDMKVISVTSNFAMDWSVIFNFGDGDTGNSTTSNWRYHGTTTPISYYISSGTQDTTEVTTDATEPAATAPPSDSSSDSSGSAAGIPDDWISGGETLSPTEPATLPSEFDPASALEEMESLTPTIEGDVLDAVSGFWYIFDSFLSASGLYWLVLLSLTIVCIAWLLGRRV